MTLTIDLEPEIERSLAARAEAKGVSLSDFVGEIVAREAGQQKPSASSSARNLAELFDNSPFKGLNMEFERDKDYGREIAL